MPVVDDSSLPPLFVDCQRDSRFYQTTHRSVSLRVIGEPALQSKAAAKGGKFESGPNTRYFATGCGSPCTISFWVSIRVASPRNWPQAMKKS